MNKNDFNLFQKYCEKALCQLTKEHIENFEDTKDEESRIKLLYTIALKLPIGVTVNNGKNLEVTKQFKESGNGYFAKKDYENALKSYNDGIIQCPQSSGWYLLISLFIVT